jgi:hypothetical protein
MTIDSLISYVRSSLLNHKKRGTFIHANPLALPVRDWQLLIGAATLLMLAAALFATLTYVGGKEQPSAPAAVDPTPRAGGDDSAFVRVLSAVQTRAQKHEQVRGQ